MRVAGWRWRVHAVVYWRTVQWGTASQCVGNATQRRALTHRTVLPHEVVTGLTPALWGRECAGRERATSVVVDMTFGGGGHTKALMDACPSDHTLTCMGIDRDPSVASRAGVKELLANRGRHVVQLLHGTSSRLFQLLSSAGDSVPLSRSVLHDNDDRSIQPFADGVVLDLGFSSFQVDDPERGFSYRTDAPLDMRMDPTSGGMTAADLINSIPQMVLEEGLRVYGEERHAALIARRIVEERQRCRIETTGQLSDLMCRVRGPFQASKGHPARLTFMALRIMVNNEVPCSDTSHRWDRSEGSAPLEFIKKKLSDSMQVPELYRMLRVCEEILVPGGRAAVITFHSQEAIAVKQVMKACCRDPQQGRSFAYVGSTIRPSREEVKQNRRCRSARLRILERTAAPLSPAAGYPKPRGPVLFR